LLNKVKAGNDMKNLVVVLAALVFLQSPGRVWRFIHATTGQ
jgi:hypothetical protein